MPDSFSAEDYQLLLNDMGASLAIRDEATLRAVMSNNVNTILGALRDAVACRSGFDAGLEAAASHVKAIGSYASESLAADILAITQ